MKNLLSLILILLSIVINAQTEFTFTIDLSQGVHKISPYIYGIAYKPYTDAKARSMNGSRMTSFNWETNVSNAGDYFDEETAAFQSDYYVPVIVGVEETNWSEPGKSLRVFQESCDENDQFSIISLPMAGYVALDTFCDNVATAPSSCWVEVQNNKTTPSIFPPDLTDGVAYNEECVQFLVNNFGNDGVDAYFLDNEPGLWFENYPYIVGLDTTNNVGNNNLSYQKLVDKAIALASTIKQINPDAEVFGPALSGYTAYDNLNLADSFEYHPLFTQYYLTKMQEFENETGVKLLDVFDIHWYTAASGVYNGELWAAEARLDAPRTLWDNSFIEEGTGQEDPLQILRRLKSTINSYYPELKIAVSEYFYGAPYHISGGLAQVDALGIFGKEDVYFASLWPNWGSFEDELDGYIRTAFDLYLNYDGEGSEFGTRSVFANTSDDKLSSVYASIDTITQNLHIIAINKSEFETATATINIDHLNDQYQNEVEVYFFSKETELIQSTTIDINDINDFEMNSWSAYHLVIKANPSSVEGYKKFDDLFSIYPNPAWHQTFRISNDSDQKIDRIGLFDNKGQLVYSKESFINGELVTFGDQPSGAYFIKIFTPNGVVVKSMIILNK